MTHGLTCHEVVRDEDGPDRVQVVVDEVASKSPAAAAGLKKGDVLLTVDKRKVTNRFDLERALWDCKAGDEVKLALSHNGRELNTNLTLSRGDGEQNTASAPAPQVAWDMAAVGTPVSGQK